MTVRSPSDVAYTAADIPLGPAPTTATSQSPSGGALTKPSCSTISTSSGAVRTEPGCMRSSGRSDWEPPCSASTAAPSSDSQSSSSYGMAARLKMSRSSYARRDSGSPTIVTATCSAGWPRSQSASASVTGR